MMSKDNPEWEAFVAMYRIRDELEASIKKAMNALWTAPSCDTQERRKWDEAYKAAEAVYEDMELWDNLQTVIDALEELNDE